MSETKPKTEQHTLSSHRGPFRLAIYDKDDELVTVWTQVKVDNVRPRVEKLLEAVREFLSPFRVHGWQMSDPELAQGATKVLSAASEVKKAEGRE